MKKEIYVVEYGMSHNQFVRITFDSLKEAFDFARDLTRALVISSSIVSDSESIDTLIAEVRGS